MEEEKKIQGNRLFPVFLKLENMHTLIVGGGKVGLEKISAVLRNSPAARITLVAEKVMPEICYLQEQHKNIAIRVKAFEAEDLDDADIVIAATADRDLSRRIKSEAEKRKLMVNVADTPELCDFYLGAIVQRGDLKIAISTNGKSPTLARRIKELLNSVLPDTVQELINSLAVIRSRLKGDFEWKVKKLNELTLLLVNNKEE